MRCGAKHGARTGSYRQRQEELLRKPEPHGVLEREELAVDDHCVELVHVWPVGEVEARRRAQKPEEHVDVALLGGLVAPVVRVGDLLQDVTVRGHVHIAVVQSTPGADRGERTIHGSLGRKDGWLDPRARGLAEKADGYSGRASRFLCGGANLGGSSRRAARGAQNGCGQLAAGLTHQRVDGLLHLLHEIGTYGARVALAHRDVDGNGDDRGRVLQTEGRRRLCDLQPQVPLHLWHHTHDKHQQGHQR